MSKKKKKDDVLDDIKKIDKIIKRNLLIKQFSKIKKKARQIMEAKKECKFLLKEIGIKDKDIKRIIDFINEMPDVQLSDEDIKEIREQCKKEIKEEKEDTTKNVEKKMNDVFTNAVSTSTSNSTSSIGWIRGDGLEFTTSDGNSLNVSI